MSTFTTILSTPFCDMRFPFGKRDIQLAYYRMRNMDPEESRMAQLQALRAVVGDHPYMMYRIHLEHARRERNRVERAWRKKKHEQNQYEWFYGGKRTAAYLSKYRFGCLTHPWFVRKVQEVTEMTVDVSNDYAVCESEPVIEYFKAANIRREQRLASMKDDESWYQPVPRVDVESDDVEPSVWVIELMRRIRCKIMAMRSDWRPKKRVPAFVKAFLSKMNVFQMEGVRGEELAKVASGNVTLTEENSSVPSVAAKPKVTARWDELCSSELATSYDYLTNRFTFFKSYEWSNTTIQGSELTGLKMELPKDFVGSFPDKCGVPITMPFSVFRYMRSDIELKFHVNSNKFQVGQLQFSWQYMEKYDGDPADDMYLRSVLPHVLVNAGSSNEATLRIPYKHMLPYMHVKQRKDSYDPLYLGTLRCFVVAPLASGANGPKSCNVSVFIKFPNCNFVGMKDGSIGEPQMEAAAATMLGMAVVDKVLGDRNCDNISDTSVPSYLVPTGSHSWSQGTGLVEPLHRLNLNGNSKGVGRPAGIDVSETVSSIPCRTFGMIRPFTWSTVNKEDNQPGALLYSCDAHPQLQKSLMYSVDINSNAMKLYSCPPVTVVSGMFKHWRGSLEFRFDIVASQFHTGRILVAYVPGFYGPVRDPTTKKLNITLEQARNCSHVVYSLQDSTSFTYVVPYVANSPWWHRKFAGPSKVADASAPSKLVVFVLNPLIRMESVVDTVQIIPYVRAGIDFEVSVPVQPANGLGRNPFVTINSGDYIYPTPGSYPYRVTNYKGFFEGNKAIFYEGTAAFGTASTFHAPETPLKKFEYFYGKAVNTSNQPSCIWKSKTKSTPNFRAAVEFIVLWSTEAGNYGVPFPAGEGESYAHATAKALRLGKPVKEIEAYLYDYVEDSNDSKGDMRFNATRYEIPEDERPKKYSELSGSFEFVSENVCQMEERYEATNKLEAMGTLAPTGFGGLVFNEKFGDLKDYMRRYQMYSNNALTLSSKFRSGETICQVPILPSGLTLDISSASSPFNILREGVIPLVTSGYVFFRGGLRFRILVSSDDIQLHGSKIWVQHVADGRMNAKLLPKVYGQLERQDRFCSHGYGSYFQPMSVNSIIEVEVPFYQPGMYGVALPPHPDVHKMQDLSQYFTLGNLSIGCISGPLTKTIQMHIQVYYSISDDLSLSTFRGFPTVVFCDEVWISDPAPKTKNEAQMMSSTFSSILSSVAGSMAGNAITKVASVTKETITDFFSTEIAGAVKIKLHPDIMNMQADLLKLKEEMANDLKDSVHHVALLTALGNVAHVIANPTIKTVAISVTNVVVAMLGGALSFVTSFVDKFVNFFSKLWHYFDVNLVEGADGVVQSDEPEARTVVIGVVSLISTVLCSLLGFTGVCNVKYFDLMKNVSATAGLANNLVHLFRNISDSIVYCTKYIITLLYPDTKYKLILDMNTPTLDKWFKECSFLCDARNKQRYLYDKTMLARVFDAASVGALIVSSGLDRHAPGGKVIWDVYKEIVKLRNDLIERGAHPDVRFECFPLFFSGPAGIGKSFLTTKLSNDLLKSINYSAPGSLIYYIAPGAKYWSGVQNPAVLVSDDMYQVSGTRLEEEIAMLFQICSSSVLNPPMAAVEDKERRLNPLLYLMFCNHKFPDFEGVARCREAIYRRRKFLVDIDLTHDIRRKYPNFVDASQLLPEERENFNHLRFRFAKNVKDPQTEYGDWMSYAEMYNIISARFKVHYAEERDHFKRRMCDMYNLDPNFEEYNLIFNIPALDECISIEEQLAIMKQSANAKLAAFNDPNLVDDYEVIRPYLDLWKGRVMSFYNKIQMEEPSTSTAVPPLSGSDFISTAVRAVKTKVVEDIDNAILNNYNGVIQPPYVQLQRGFKWFLDSTAIHATNCPLITTSLDNLRDVKNRYHASLYSFHKFFMDHPRESEEISSMFAQFTRVPLRNDHAFYIHYDALMSEMDFDVFEKFSFLAQFCPSARRRLLEMLFLSVEGRYKSIKTPCMPDNFFSVPWSDTMLGMYDMIRPSIIEVLDPEIVLANRNTFIKEFWKEFQGRLNRDFEQAPDIEKMCIKLTKSNLDLSELEDALRGLSVTVLKLDTQLCEMAKSQTACLIGTLFSAIGLLRCLFGEDHCEYQQNVFKCFDTKRSIKYCALRDVFSGGDDITLECRHKHGMCCHPYLSVMVMISADSCLHFNFRERNIDCRLQFYDIQGMVVNRRQVRVNTFWTKVKNYVSHWFYHFLPKFLVKLLEIIFHLVPLVLSFFLSYKLFTAIKGEWKDNHNSCEQGPNYYKFDTPKVPVKQAGKIPVKSFAQPQLSAASRSVLGKKISNNACIMYVSWIEDNMRVNRNCKCLVLYGRKMLVLRHYLEEYSAIYNKGFNLTCSLFFQSGGHPCTVPLSFKDILRDVLWCGDSVGDAFDSNFGLVQLPVQVPSFKNITSCFATYKQHENVGGLVDIYTIGADCSFGMPLRVDYDYSISAGVDHSGVRMAVAYTYMKQAYGLCGSVLVSPHLNQGNGAIIGIHVAGNSSTGRGAAEPIYRELIEETFSTSSRILNPEVLMPDLQDLSQEDIVLDSNLMLYGKIDPKFAHRESGKSKIEPSLLHNSIYPVRTEINPLRPNDPRQPVGSDPLRDGCNKHGSGNISTYDPDLVEEVGNSIADRMCQIMRPVRAKVEPLSMQQAVCGDVDVPYFQSLNWKSSEGFPLSASRPSGVHDKRWLFNLTEGEFGYKLHGVHRDLEVALKLRNECYNRGAKPITIYTDCLKDYRLTPEKCKIPGKTRIFSVAPIQCTIDMKIHLGDFCASLKNSRIQNSIGIGINPDSFEWTQLANYLLGNSRFIITLDYSNFGPTLMSQLVAASNKCIVEWHKFHEAGEDHVNRVEWLLTHDILNPVHLCKDLVYQTVNGIASGSPLTGECNSIPNLFYMMLTYLEIMKSVKPLYANCFYFHQFVRLVVYGDDLIMSVHEEIIDDFNALSIRDALCAHGIRVTPASKDAEMVPYTSIYEATFLKRGFARHPTRTGIWLAPLAPESIEEIVNWVHASNDPKEALLENCRSSLDLAYSRGKDYFNSHYKKIITGLKSLGLTLSVKDWEVRDREIFEEDSNVSGINSLKCNMPWYYRLGELSLQEM